MYLPLSFLKQFIKLKANATEIAEKLTLSGSEVEKIIDNSMGLSKIVIGQIKSIAPHPDADNLQLAYVDVGGAKDLEIVCGAKNIKPGQKVPIALLGGSVPGMKIDARKIRGIASQGMLCSQKELGIGDDHSGIYILPNDAKIGKDIVSYLELYDPVLELDITPNRPDCFSILGLAREVAALYGKSLMLSKTQHQTSKFKESGTPASSSVQVKIEDKKLCPKYCARVIQGVNVKESPLWLQNKLRQVGIRPINNIVDITNYVMMELGHPMHAFDANLVEADARGQNSALTRIVVRHAKKGEKILALDEEIYALSPDMLVIADSKKPIAIAGIMGGKDSSVTKGTNNIILEAAIFDQKSIRKTSKALGLRSESSSRFEKGIDPEAVELAIDRAVSLIKELAGGAILKGIVSAGEAKKQPLRLRLAVHEVKRILGIDVPLAKIKSILLSLGFACSGKDIIKVQVPSWRAHDIKISEDLIEEIGRMLDYNTMPKTLPTSELASHGVEPAHSLRHNLRHFLAGAGYSELLAYSFYNEKLLELSGIAKSHHMLLANPVNDEYPYLRASLEPWILEKLSQNSALLSRDSFCIFEIGKVFHKTEGESWQAGIGIIDTNKSNEELFRLLRGALESFLVRKITTEKEKGKYVLREAGKGIACIAIYSKGSALNLRFRSDCAVMIIDLEALAKVLKQERFAYNPIPYYPVIERDLGLVVPNVVQYREIAGFISKFNPLIKNVELFDVYHGLDKGMSIALRLTFSSLDRTLESKEVDEIMEKLRSQLEKKFNIAFR